MSAILETQFRSTTEFETVRWDEVVVVATRNSVPGWRPAVNAYRCIEKFVIFVDLAGVPPESIETKVFTDRLIIRGHRPAPEPSCQRSDLTQLLALEIDQGSFQRVLDLPQKVDPERFKSEYRHGLLRIELPLSL